MMAQSQSDRLVIGLKFYRGYQVGNFPDTIPYRAAVYTLDVEFANNQVYVESEGRVRYFQATLPEIKQTLKDYICWYYEGIEEKDIHLNRNMFERVEHWELL